MRRRALRNGTPGHGSMLPEQETRREIRDSRRFPRPASPAQTFSANPVERRLRRLQVSTLARLLAASVPGHSCGPLIVATQRQARADRRQPAEGSRRGNQTTAVIDAGRV